MHLPRRPSAARASHIPQSDLGRSGLKHLYLNRAPSGIAYGLGHAVVGRIRRLTYKDGSSVMYGKAGVPEFRYVEGYEDHQHMWLVPAILIGIHDLSVAEESTMERTSKDDSVAWQERAVDYARIMSRVRR